MSIIKQSVERTCGSYLYVAGSPWCKMVVDHIQDIANSLIDMDIGFTQYSASIAYTLASNPYVILKHSCGSLYLMVSTTTGLNQDRVATDCSRIWLTLSNSPLFTLYNYGGAYLNYQVYSQPDIYVSGEGNALYRRLNIVCYRNDVNNFSLRFTPYTSKAHGFNFGLMESEDFSNNKLPMVLIGTTFKDAVSTITTPATLGTISGAIVSGASGVSIYGYGIIRECQFYNGGYIQCKKILNLYDYLGDGTIVAGGLYTIGDSNYLAISTTLLYKY